jgi:hypothetical protein
MTNFSPIESYHAPTLVVKIHPERMFLELLLTP